MRVKRIAAALSAFTFALTLGACGSKDDHVLLEQHEQTEISLSWWGNDIRNEYTIEAVSRFEKLHPDIKVKCSYSEWSGYEARSQVQMVSGTEADVMQINVGWLSQYSADGKGYYDIEKLTDTVDLSNFSDEMLEFGRRNGILNAVPIAMNAETLYVNKTLYEKYGLDIPKTWDDLFAAAKVMSPDGVYPISGASKSTWLYCIAYAEQNNGKHFFNENNEITFSSEDFRIMIDLYNRLVSERVMPKVEDYQRFNLENLVYAGTIAWVSDALNYNQATIDRGSEVVAADYTVSDGMKAGVGWYEKPATLYAISRNTSHPEEAALLLDYMLNSPGWAQLQGVEKGIPVSLAARDYLNEQGMLEGLQYEASLVMENNTEISPMNSLIEDTFLIDEFINACDLVLFEKNTAEEAAAMLVDKYKENYTFAE
ncbi:MAG: ABC transporter substrate-binding protein [Ruminococcus sp.]|nr:ABC transporter substrate-binding protein [Ruminococcus sp.]